MHHSPFTIHNPNKKDTACYNDVLFRAGDRSAQPTLKHSETPEA